MPIPMEEVGIQDIDSNNVITQKVSLKDSGFKRDNTSVYNILRNILTCTT